jgi:hypothetical protein
METKLLIHTHLGLGDHFVCNGLVRYVIEHTDYDSYVIPAKEHNAPTVERMYCDLKNTTVLSVKNDNDVYHNISSDMKVLRVGFEHMDYSVNFDESFYKQLNIPLEYKRTYFKVCRDSENEKKCFEHYNPPDKYIFVHNTSSVGTFDLNIKSDLPIITPKGYDFTLLDYLYLIENAEEIHCIDSSFLNMIDLAVELDKMFFHRLKKTQYPMISNNWKVVEYENSNV